MKTAVIGLGSNSLRLLIADIDYNNKTIKNRYRDRVGIRILTPDQFTPVGNISDAMIKKAIKSINFMKQKAVDFGAKEVSLFATSATRDANNKDFFIDELKQYTGLNLELISGDDEAFLSFIGTSGGSNCGMIDIGGGSTEFAIGDGSKLYYLNSFQMGAVRLYRQSPINSNKDIENAISEAKNVFLIKKEEIVNSIQKAQTSMWFGVGGTFTSLAAIIQNIAWNEYDKIHNFEITYDDVYNKIQQLSDISIDDRKKTISMQPGRADIVVNGMAVLLACMELFNINKLKVSTKGNLDGYLIKKYLL